MLTRIVRNSPKLGAFLDELHLGLSRPQRQHLLNLADALLVCEDDKTLAALQRQFLNGPDPSNMADFLRISPWSANTVRNALRQQQVRFFFAEAERLGLDHAVSINIDDSLGDKGKATRHLEPVDWFHDHRQPGGGERRYRKAYCYVEATLRAGPLTVTVDLRLYLRAKTVRRLNRQRPPERRLHFRSKYHLAYAILEALQPLLPPGWAVTVQFDSWYASAKLIKYIRRHGWHVVCRLKSNRTLDGKRLVHVNRASKHRWSTRVRVTAADGTATVYLVRQTWGFLTAVPFMVRVFITRRHPRGNTRAYFMSTDVTRSAEQTLRGYGGRWSCEVVNFYLKTQLGLSDFRVRSYEAVDKYLVAVLLTWAYVERRFSREHSAAIRTCGDLIRRHREEHAESWLTEALRLAIATGRIEPVVRRFLRRPA